MTDAEGRFLIRGLPDPGGWRIDAWLLRDSTRHLTTETPAPGLLTSRPVPLEK
jgi:hypothetical protein